MGMQIWFREDIANAIRAAGAASLAALLGLATAFGLPAEPKPPQVLEFRREEEGDRWRP